MLFDSKEETGARAHCSFPVLSSPAHSEFVRVSLEKRLTGKVERLFHHQGLFECLVYVLAQCWRDPIYLPFFFFQRNVFKSSFPHVSGDESMKLPPLFRVQISLWGLSLSWSCYCHYNIFIWLLLHEGKRRLVLLAKCLLRVTLNTGGHLTIAAWGGWLYVHFGSRRIEALRCCEGSGMPWGGLWREFCLIFACIQVSGVILRLFKTGRQDSFAPRPTLSSSKPVIF